MVWLKWKVECDGCGWNRWIMNLDGME